MNHRSIYSLLLAFCLSIVFGVNAQAQNSITPVLIMSPNPSPYISDWQSQPQTILVTAQLDQALNQAVKLMAQISLNGQTVATTNAQKLPSISLHQGMNTFNAAQVIPYNAVDVAGGVSQTSQRTGRLPEGSYRICVWFIEAESNKPLGEQACSGFSLRDVEPPVLLNPSDGAMLSSQAGLTKPLVAPTKSFTLPELVKLDKNELPYLNSFEIISKANHFVCTRPELTRINSGAMNSNIIQPNSTINTNNAARLMEEEGIFYYRYEMKEVMVSGVSKTAPAQEINPPNFSWLPPSPPPAQPVKYVLRIVPVYPNQSGQQAITTATPALEKRGLTSTIFHDEDNFQGLRVIAKQTPNIRFAWAVQVTDQNDNPIGKNNGWSEVRVFTVGDDRDIEANFTKGGKKKTPVVTSSFFDVFDKIDSPKVKAQCPFIEKKLLRTVAGGWKKIKTEVVSLSSGTGTYAKVHVTWQRTVWNVSHVSHCTLAKDHPGLHKMDKGSDVFEKAFNITITTEYGEREPQTPPAKAPGDELPQEDPK